MKQAEENIVIPDELRQYQRLFDIEEKPRSEVTVPNFGVHLVRKSEGQIDFVAYYSDEGELLKKVFYNGSTLAHIMYYRNGRVCKQEDYIKDNLSRMLKFDKTGNITCSVAYTYDRREHITSIQKVVNHTSCKVEYGYDELERVNSRKLSVNNKIQNEQYYRYDILDRIVMYKDLNQTINVNEVGTNNKLVRYDIQDKKLNLISVHNKFEQEQYKETNLTLNGHTVTVKNKNYVDNPMLRKPYTREDDLDFMMTTLFKQDTRPTKREIQSGTVEFRVNTGMDRPILPISIRKTQLLYSRAGF